MFSNFRYITLDNELYLEVDNVPVLYELFKLFMDNTIN